MKRAVAERYIEQQHPHTMYAAGELFWTNIIVQRGRRRRHA